MLGLQFANQQNRFGASVSENHSEPEKECER